MNPSRETFFDTLEHLLIPRVKNLGFSGNPWEFTRHVSNFYHCFSLQEQSDRQACCVNMGIQPDFIPISSGTTLSESQCEIRIRLSPTSSIDFWWEFGRSNIDATKSATDLFQTFDKKGLEIYNQFIELPGCGLHE